MGPEWHSTPSKANRLIVKKWLPRWETESCLRRRLIEWGRHKLMYLLHSWVRTRTYSLSWYYVPCIRKQCLFLGLWETASSVLITPCWASFAQAIWPREKTAQTLKSQVIFTLKETDWYVLPFFVQQLRNNGLTGGDNEKKGWSLHAS